MGWDRWTNTTGWQPRGVFGFAFRDGRIGAIDLLADPEHMRQLDPAVLDG